MSILQVSILIRWATWRRNRPVTDIPSAFISIICTPFLAVLSWLHHRTTNAPSGILEVALFFSSVFEAVHVRSYWLRAPELQTLAITTSICLAAKLTFLVMEMQPKKEGCKVGSSTKSSVELRYGLLAQISFWWLNPLFCAGYRSDILLKRLWAVDTALSSKHLADTFDKATPKSSKGKSVRSVEPRRSLM